MGACFCKSRWFGATMYLQGCIYGHFKSVSISKKVHGQCNVLKAAKSYIKATAPVSQQNLNMASVLSGLMRFNKNNLSSSIFNGNGAPQTMPKTAPGIVKDLGPDGFWDRNVGKRGPTGPLEQDYSKKQALEKHILTNQTPHVQYINATHIVVPQRLPNSEDAAVSWLDLAKSVHAGDVVWALRCPPPMVGAQFASNLTRKTQYNYTCSVRLQRTVCMPRATCSVSDGVHVLMCR